VSTQPGLFPDTVLPYRRRSRTSRDAAVRAESQAPNQQRRVLNFLRGTGTRGATDEQIAAALNLNPSAARPRRVELVEEGLVYDSKRTAKTSSGRSAVLWVASPKAAL
jgi:predicted ArsR family transcriptional regulator